MSSSPIKTTRPSPLIKKKFQDPNTTVCGKSRARVDLGNIDTLWFNTGTLCNLTCRNCYILSIPKNDSLVYLKLTEVEAFIKQLTTSKNETREIGFTGGEPFMNPYFVDMLKLCLSKNFKVLVLTNAMKPMMRKSKELISLREKFCSSMKIRVSLDHYSKKKHEEERGLNSWDPAIEGLKWLCTKKFKVCVAGRLRWSENERKMRTGFFNLFEQLGLDIDAHNASQLVLFPEMDEQVDVPEITQDCWQKLSVNPSDVMCANSRMILRRKGSSGPSVVPCTLLADDPQFDLGGTLTEASRRVSLNHPNCSRFCILGGGSCTTS